MNFMHIFGWSFHIFAVEINHKKQRRVNSQFTTSQKIAGGFSNLRKKLKMIIFNSFIINTVQYKKEISNIDMYMCILKREDYNLSTQ